jgi:hypothetical protein
VIPHLPERDPALYAEAIASVRGQTRLPDQLIVESDPNHTGCAATLNRALERVECEWIAVLGDDDYLLPNHLAVLEAHLAADVLYPDFLQLGAFHGIGGPFDETRLRDANYIPGGGSLIRTAAARMVGGWCRRDDPDWHQFEDWVMWLRLLDAGCSFEHVPVTTWAYRFGDHQTGGQV